MNLPDIILLILAILFLVAGAHLVLLQFMSRAGRCDHCDDLGFCPDCFGDGFDNESNDCDKCSGFGNCVKCEPIS